jgi:hypothetical protein
MPSQFSAKARSGRIDNRVTGRIELSGDFAPLLFELTENCMRDIAGCVLDFECGPTTTDIDYTPPTGKLEGSVGEMTAPKRLVLPGPYSDEFNCLNLEWFDCDDNCTALFKPNARCRTSSAEWRMTEIEELEQKGRRWQHLGNQGPNRDNEWFQMAGILGVALTNLDESEWEELLQEADNEVERLTHLFDRNDADPDWYGPLSRALGWTEVEPNRVVIDTDSVPEHPRATQPALDSFSANATSLLTYLVAQVPSNASLGNPFNRMLSRIAQVSAVGLLETLLANRQFSPKEHGRLRDQLFSLREDALNTMGNLRRN